ncbi:MAG TPA: ABC transporter ATP-binding protein [Vicinamibacterales bacterium]|nr:ABC transporter ATP-binding protein [Vicinamibacterales bacterium]
MSAHAVEIRGLCKSQGTFTLGPLDLTVPEGALYGLVGPNGAGKTTTLDLIFGMGGRSRGTIRVLGLDHLRDEVAMKRQVGYVSPELTYQAWGRVGAAMDFVRGFHASWDNSYADRLLGTFGLERRAAIATLSFGARTKLGLVLALAWRPKLLVLDEPTVGLDAISKQQVFAELLAAVGEGRTVLISSHAITDLERFADHVGMIKGGRMVFGGLIDAVVDRYRLVDVEAGASVRFDTEPGVWVQHREANRWRLLLDRETKALDAIRDRGASCLSEAPVTLEELFIALGRS